MKRLFIITLTAIGIVSLLLKELIIYQVFMPDWSRNEYKILRLSPESNIRGAEDDYFFRYGEYGKDLFYSFKTEETTTNSFLISLLLHMLIPTAAPSPTS